jgi:adenylylsulfate kinase
MNSEIEMKLDHQKATNITWHEGAVTQADRERKLNQKGQILWFTGLSGSGKSTVAVELERELFLRGYITYRLDGDNIRHGLNKNLGFTKEDRDENIRRIGEVAKLMQEAGIIVLCSFISPHKDKRQFVRSLVDDGKFIEVFVDADVDTCIKRDPKGLYKKAIAGEIPNFTGISAPYDVPENPELIINTAVLSLEQSVEKIIEALKF